VKASRGVQAERHSRALSWFEGDTRKAGELLDRTGHLRDGAVDVELHD
jgi:hypothetical protein